MNLVGFNKKKSKSTIGFEFNTDRGLPVLCINGEGINRGRNHWRKPPDNEVLISYAPVIELNFKYVSCDNKFAYVDDIDVPNEPTDYGKLHAFRQTPEYMTETYKIPMRGFGELMRLIFIGDYKIVDEVCNGKFVTRRSSTYEYLYPLSNKEFESVNTIRYENIVKEEKKEWLKNILKTAKKEVNAKLTE
jgi:hypothetical protein